MLLAACGGGDNKPDSTIALIDNIEEATPLPFTVTPTRAISTALLSDNPTPSVLVQADDLTITTSDVSAATILPLDLMPASESSFSKEPTARPTPTPTATARPSPTPKSGPRSSSDVVPIATVIPTATPWPTPTAAPNLTVPPVPLAPAPTFVSSTKFEGFPETLQSAFSIAVVDEFAAAYQKAGVSAAVFDGKKLWTEALGIASDTAQMTSTTPMIIRSTSKTFLSAMMLTQIENGLYKLTDTVEALLSDHPDYPLIDIDYINTDVTVEQLLTMTSGISDWSEDINSQLQIMQASTWKPADNLSKIPSPFVEPGSYHYSYANSILLGLITTHYGGKNINSLYQETFFKPLGLSGGLLTEVAQPPDTAAPYDDLQTYGFGAGFGNLRAGEMAVLKGKDPRISWVGAAIVSTPENIAQWGYELFSPSGSAISDANQTQLINSLTVQTDTSISGLGVHTYGYFIGMADVRLSDGTSIKTYNHPGGGGGRTSWLYYAPSLDVSISLLANSMLLHDLGSCGYAGLDYMSVGECMAGGIFSSLLGMPVPD
jgi:CubicO group peptidase (beta-lactamase class C family)